MTEQSRANTGGLQTRFYAERPDGLPIESYKRFPIILETSGDDPEAVEAAAFYDFLGGNNPGLIIERADGQPYPEHKRYSHALEITGDDEPARCAAAFYAFLKHSRGLNEALAADILAALENPLGAPAQHRYAQ